MARIIGFTKIKKRKRTCKSCGAVVEFDESDIHSLDFHDRGGGPDGGIDFVQCPNPVCEGVRGRIVVKQWD